MPPDDAQSSPELALFSQEMPHFSIFFWNFPPVMFFLPLAGTARRHGVALGRRRHLMEIQGPHPDRDDQEEEPDPANGIGLLQQIFPS